MDAVINLMLLILMVVAVSLTILAGLIILKIAWELVFKDYFKGIK